MAVVFTEDWTGGNGSAWNATRWTDGRSTSGGGSTVLDIQSNQGREGNTASGQGTAILSATSALSDMDLRISFGWASASQNMTGEVFYHVGGNLTSGYPVQGYLATMLRNGNSNTSGIYLERVDAGPTWVGLDDDLTVTFADTDRRWCRILVEGSRHRIKVWKVGDSEPGTWNIDITDSVYSSGRVLLGSYGLASPVGTVQWDDLTIDDTPGVTITKSIPFRRNPSRGLIMRGRR